MARPLQIGDAHNVVVELSLSRDALEWLAYCCPDGDAFTKDLFDTLERVDREAEEEAADIVEFGRPALAIRVGPDGAFFDVYCSHDPSG
jgi:phosphate uptake regulator